MILPTENGVSHTVVSDEKQKVAPPSVSPHHWAVVGVLDPLIHEAVDCELCCPPWLTPVAVCGHSVLIENHVRLLMRCRERAV